MESELRRIAFPLILGLAACAKSRAPEGAHPLAPPSAPSEETAPAPESSTEPRGDGGKSDATLDAAVTARPTPDGMLLVPAGTFTMGADRGGQEDEHPAHEVTVRGFWLDRTEVTNAAYALCVAAKACGPNDAHLASREHEQDDRDFAHPLQPVTGVTWENAHDYCAWRGTRLPSEAEFEKAARDTDGRRFPWGNETPTAERTAFGRVLGKGAPDEVGAHPLGRGPYGHDDLAGNVWEWTEDLYDPFAYRRPSAGEGRPGTCDEILAAERQLLDSGMQGYTGSNPIPTGCERVLRGGAFNYDAPGLRSTNRVHHPGGFHLVMAGFRCAKEATE